LMHTSQSGDPHPRYLLFSMGESSSLVWHTSITITKHSENSGVVK